MRLAICQARTFYKGETKTLPMTRQNAGRRMSSTRTRPGTEVMPLLFEGILINQLTFQNITWSGDELSWEYRSVPG
jgi:hypothetical protein